MLKIDCHTHILPPKWPDFKQRYGYGGFVRLDHHRAGCARMMVDDRFFREIDSNCWDPTVRLKECDALGVHVQVLSTVPVMFSYWAKPADADDLSRLLNDHIAEVVANAPKRFIGLGTLPLQDPDRAIRELERCMGELGMAGVQIGSHVNDWNLDQPELFPIFQAAERLGAAIFVHPWDMLGKERMRKYWFPWLIGMPTESTLAICSLIFSGVLEKLPKLRIAFAHGGGSFPGTLGRIAHGFAARPDLCAVDNPVDPREYIERIYLDSLVHDPRQLSLILDMFGPERIAMGTDYPFPLGEDQPGALIASLGLNRTVEERLLAGTALEWLNRRKEQFLA